MDSLGAPSSMASSADESLLVDKLRTIRPFTECQLLALYSNDELGDNHRCIDQFILDNGRVNDCQFYQQLVRLERAKEKHALSSDKVDQLVGSGEQLQDKIWSLHTVHMTKPGKCLDGRSVEARHQHQEATMNGDRMKQLEKTMMMLRTAVAGDLTANHYQAQLAQLEVECFISDIIDENDDNRRRFKLRKALTALFAVQRKPKAHDDPFLEMTKNWLTSLVAALLSIATIDDHLFLLNHVLRCPAGSSSWNAGFIQCKCPDLKADPDLGLVFINHCLTVISTILSPITGREKFLGAEETVCKKEKKRTSDDTWMLVDPEVDEGEEVTSSHLQIAECDVIRYLKQVPLELVLQLVTRFGSKDISNGNSNEETTELIMLKLLAFSTTLIRTLKQGLQTFNCIRFKSLTDLISHLIRRTVLTVSDFWNRCQQKFQNHDRALILRLQVEYDHFILRSIAAILGTNRQGVWRFLAVVPFEGVTESMMWHILWVVYNNGRDEHDDAGGLCPYFSDTYWRCKFLEATVQFLFREKLQTLPEVEAHCLLTSLFNMAKSRDKSQAEFVSTVASEIFEIAFQTPSVADRMTAKGHQVLVKLTESFDFLVGVFIDKVAEGNTCEDILELFAEIPLSHWRPAEESLSLLDEWLVCCSTNDLLNRLSRVIWSRLNWNFEGQQPFLSLPTHRHLAVKIFEAIDNHVPRDAKNLANCGLKQYGYEKILVLAKSPISTDFIKWCWLQLISLKLHLTDQASFDWNTLFSDSFTVPEWFEPVPKIIDAELVPILRGIEENHRFAVFIAVLMSDVGHDTDSADKTWDHVEGLLTNMHLIPGLHLFSILFVYHVRHLPSLLANQKLISTLSQMIVVQSEEMVAVFSHQMTKLNIDNQLKLLVAWTSLLYEVTGAILKLSASSWFGSNTKGIKELAFIFDKMVMIIYGNEELRKRFVEHLAANPYDMANWKLPSPGFLTSLFNWSSSATIKKCDWLTPLHVLNRHLPSLAFLGWAVTASDTIRTDKVWEEVVDMVNDAGFDLELAIKTVCTRHHQSPVPTSLLPLFAWSTHALNVPVGHDLDPLIWFRFFVVYFSNGDSSGSIGIKLLTSELKKKLNQRLNQLIDHHHRVWVSSEDPSGNNHHGLLTRLYRAYVTWLEDGRLHEVYVNLDQLPGHYMTALLKSAMSNGDTEALLPFIDDKHIQVEASVFSNLFSDFRLTANRGCSCESIVDDTTTSVCSLVRNTTTVAAPEEAKSNWLSVAKTLESVDHDSAALMVLMQQNIRLILEEAKFFDSCLGKFDNLNQVLFERLPELYRNVRQELKCRVACEKDDYDHCLGPASISIEFVEATLNQPMAKQIDRNRVEFGHVVEELRQTPSPKVISASVYIDKCLSMFLKKHFLTDHSAIGSNLLGPLLSWLSENSDGLYSPAKQTFALLLEALSSAADHNPDATNQYILDSAMNYPKIIQFFAPRLEPSRCSSDAFLSMYQQIQVQLKKTPSHVSFVLLSKFDVAAWLRTSGHDLKLSLIQTLGDALYSLGQNPAEDKLMVLGLYRKHLQYVIIDRFPEQLTAVLQMLLTGMNDLKVTASLWNDVLLSFGLFLGSERPDYLYNELKKYANAQPLFGANELYDLMSLLANYFNQIQVDHPLEVLDHFKAYIHRYVAVLATISFCWVNTNSRMPPGTVKNVWDPFISIWSPWLFPKRSTKFIDSSDLIFVWENFVMNVRYFIECFQGLLSDILSCTWQTVLRFVIDTKAISDNEIAIMQRQLSGLPWNRFAPSLADMRMMLEAIRQVKYDVTEMVGCVVSKVSWSHASQQMIVLNDDLSEALECLCYLIIGVSVKIKTLNNLQLKYVPFYFLTPLKVQIISQMLVREVRLRRLFGKSNDCQRDNLLLALLKDVCLVSSDDDNQWMKKHLIYARSWLGLIIEAVVNDLELMKKSAEQLKDMVTQLMVDLKPAICSKSSSERTDLFHELFNTINNITEEQVRSLYTDQLIQSLKTVDAQLINEMVTIVCQTVSSHRQLVMVTEPFIDNFVKNEGDLNEFLKNFKVEGPAEDFLVECVFQNAHLNIYAHFFSQFNDPRSPNKKNSLISMLTTCTQLKMDNESKTLLLWYKAVEESGKRLSEDENQEDEGVELHQALLRLNKHLFSVVDEHVSQGILSFVKFSRKSIAASLTLSILGIAVFGGQQLVYSLGSNKSLVQGEAKSQFKSMVGKLNNLKKNKTFVELVPAIDSLLNAIEGKDSENIRLKEVNQLVRGLVLQVLSGTQEAKHLRVLVL